MKQIILSAIIFALYSTSFAAPLATCEPVTKNSLVLGAKLLQKTNNGYMLELTDFEGKSNEEEYIFKQKGSTGDFFELPGVPELSVFIENNLGAIVLSRLAGANIADVIVLTCK